MPDLDLLEDIEKEEIISSIEKAFDAVQFIGKFIDSFLLSVHVESESPSVILSSLLNEGLGIKITKDLMSIQNFEELMDIFNQKDFQVKFDRQWNQKMQKGKTKGHVISSITADVTQSYLQNTESFSKGPGSNDLVRNLNGSRWEIKGARSKSFKLTINQSHVGLNETHFIVYNGFPEERLIHGIYLMKGKEQIFTAPQKGRNMRNFITSFFDSEVEQIYPTINE